MRGVSRRLKISRAEGTSPPRWAQLKSPQVAAGLIWRGGVRIAAPRERLGGVAGTSV